MLKYKRTLKSLFNRTGRGQRKVSPERMLTFIALLSAIFFIATQLITNAILSPLGHQLQAYNNEKNQLIEQNRIIEQSIAKNSSLPILEKYSEEKFSLKSVSNKNTVYVNDTTIQASTLNE